jgi:2-C-methyl-D-erythritol 4-phosphate cytidylyltransferase
MATATAVLLAAGTGARLGGDTPKAFRALAGRPILLRTLDRLFAATSVASVIAVVGPDEIERCEALIRSDYFMRQGRWSLQVGGATRQQSAKLGLERVPDESALVILHDAARPFVSPTLIDRCVEAAADKGAVTVGLPVRDTIKEVSAERWIRATPERSSLWEIQTPQVFERELIMRAHQEADRDGISATDDATLVERMGTKVHVIEGERTNIKITFAEDLRLAELMVLDRLVR